MKPDKSIKNICIAAIKRHTIKPYNFSLTAFFESGLPDELLNIIPPNCYITAEELPISIVLVDQDNYTFVTTRQIITRQNGITTAIKHGDIIWYDWSDFKGHADKNFTIGRLTLIDKSIFEVFIETGKPSIIIIYSIKTLSGQYQ